MKRSIILGIVFSLLGIHHSYAQWTKVNSVPTHELVAFVNIGDTLYVAGTNLIYKSIDGASWSATTVSPQPIEVSVLKLINDVMYMGTYNHGIFISADHGSTWSHFNNSLPTVSGFVQHGNHIYASTIGNGVLKHDTASGNWVPFNNQLPNYSSNVFSIISTSNDLIMTAGANGTFYVYDFVLSTWVEKYFYGSNLPGLDIDEMITHADTLYAVNRNRIIRSNDGGLSWTDDKVGTHNASARFIYAGCSKFYTLTNFLGGGVWVQERNKNGSIGSTWNVNEAFLLYLTAFDIVEYNNKLFLATDSGLYTKAIALSNETPIDLTDNIKVYPNPSQYGEIKISSPVRIKEISITDMLGRVLLTSTVAGYDHHLEQHLEEGMYLVHIYPSDGPVVSKKLMVAR